MRTFDFVSIKLTLCLVVGIIIGFYFEIGPRLPFFALLSLFPVLYWSMKKQPRDGLPFFELGAMCFTIVLGMLVLALSQKMPNHYSQVDFQNEQFWHLKISEELKPNPYAQNYVAEVIAVGYKKSTGKVLLNLQTDSTREKYAIDDELLISGQVQSIPSPLNPNQFNYREYLKKLGIQHRIKAHQKSIFTLGEHSETLVGKAARIRENIIAKLKKQHFGEEELAVIQALLLGQRDDISENTYNNYKNAGAVHILAVSGLHVGILLLLLEFLLSPLDYIPKGRVLKLIIIVLLLWLYAFIAGLSPSIIRAVTMFTFFAYALYLNRPTNSFNIIALSMLSILLMKPLMLFQVGFQMSYAAVIAIVWIYPKLQKFWFPNNWLVRKTWQLLSVSIAAQLGVLPISLFYFHQFPALFFVSNLLIIPFLGLILGMGILVITLSSVGQLPIFLAQIYNWVIATMNSIVGWVGQQESFIVKDIPFDRFQLIAGYLVIITLVVLLSKPRWKTAIILAIGIVGLQIHALWSHHILVEKEQLLLLHQSRNTVLLDQNGRHLSIYAKNSSNLERLVANHSVAERVQSTSYIELKNSYQLFGKQLYIVDSLGIYPTEKQLDYMLLTQSPKINLERLLDSACPKIVLADGNNYRSYIERWRQTCAKRKIPFHYTGKKGYYVFNSVDD
ncbi:ComEC/Rec2 family competence protein [Flagellimonas meishanensis]|uniref:ComEC/Rec2 family competence protein n=1 Tax=Flagellimonas meishanensis TaxID=2873264 RepID=UPI001CA6767D|nr:ComEC/Rec2 family competence protein [[Muricauda] meishanensis]